MPFNRLDHSILGEIRPRFKLKIDIEPQKALNHCATKLFHDKTVSGDRSDHLIFLRIPSWQQHYWSPEMTVRIEQEEFMDYPTVSCLIGPKQTVWALFAFGYAALSILGLFGGIFSYVLYSNEGNSSWLWIAPVAVCLLIGLYFASKIGQNKGRDQMLHLVSFIYHSLDEIAKVERVER